MCLIPLYGLSGSGLPLSAARPPRVGGEGRASARGDLSYSPKLESLVCWVWVWVGFLRSAAQATPGQDLRFVVERTPLPLAGVYPLNAGAPHSTHGADIAHGEALLGRLGPGLRCSGLPVVPAFRRAGVPRPRSRGARVGRARLGRARVESARVGRARLGRARVGSLY